MALRWGSVGSFSASLLRATFQTKRTNNIKQIN